MTRTHQPRFFLLVFSALALCAPAWTATVVAITELLRNPLGTEDAIPGGRSHEFVEIANLGTDTLTLDSLFLSDGLDADSVKPWRDLRGRHPNCIAGVRFVRPGQVAVILDPDYDSGCALDPSRSYEFADSTLLLTVGDSHLGDYSNLAENDGVFLYKGTVSRVDRLLAFAADSAVQVPPESGSKLLFGSLGTMPDGVSVSLRSLLFGRALYGPCPTGVSLGTVELLRQRWLIDYRFGEVGDSAVVCTLAVLRSGARAVGAAVAVRRAGGGVSVGTLALGQGPFGEERFAATIPLDGAGYEVEVTCSLSVVVQPLDLSAVWVPAGGLRVSEVFPKAGSGGPEWFELVNMSGLEISLDGWRFGDDEDTVVLSGGGVSVAPGAYLVVTEDLAAFGARFPTVRTVIKPPRWHTLTNTRDSLCLWDRFGRLHESVYWADAWFKDWQSGSIERLSLSAPAVTAKNWAVANPPSPGRPNGSATWRRGDQPQVSIGPLPFTPNGDGRDDWLTISVTLPAGATLAIEIYAMDGRKVREFAGEPQAEYRWDGRTDGGSWAPAGPFFVAAKVGMPDGGTVLVRKKGVLWR